MNSNQKDILLQSPFSDAELDAFQSETPSDAKIKVEDLFRFRRGRGDLFFSAVMLAIAGFLLITFFTHTGWADRKLPDGFLTYLGQQLGLIEAEGRLSRFGRILKQGWVGPLLALAILVPAALINLRASVKTFKWRKRFKQPTNMRYEFSKWLSALEFVAYFLVYTYMVPILGYLFSTLLLGMLLPMRLGYRGPKWLGLSLLASLTIVLIFRTFLQIKTPVNIWLYEQLPQNLETFMKVYF